MYEVCARIDRLGGCGGTVARGGRTGCHAPGALQAPCGAHHAGPRAPAAARFGVEALLPTLVAAACPERSFWCALGWVRLNGCMRSAEVAFALGDVARAWLARV